MRTSRSTSPYFRLAEVFTAIFLMMSGFYVVEALQSSLNRALGTYAMTAMFITVACVSIFLPTLAMGFVKKNRLMAMAVIPCMLFTLANLYPRGYTLIPAAILQGCGLDVIMITAAVYATNLADRHAEITNGDKAKITSRFVGFSSASYSLAKLTGNALSSVVMNSLSQRSRWMGSEELTTVQTATMLENTSVLQCGVHNCDCWRKESCEMLHGYQYGDNSRLETTVIYPLMSGLAIMQFISALMLWRTVDEGIEAGIEINEATEQRLIRMDHTDGLSKANAEEVETITMRIRAKVFATGKLYIIHPVAILIIPFSIHAGLLHGFVMAQVTRDWITCSLGIQSVGYGVSCYAIGSIIGSLSHGIFLHYVPRWTIVLIFLLMEMTGVTMLWTCDKESASWILYVAIGVIGTVQQFFRSINVTINSIYFPGNKEAAIAAMATWFCLGKGLEFALSTHMCNLHNLIFLISIGILAILAYFISEAIYAKLPV